MSIKKSLPSSICGFFNHFTRPYRIYFIIMLTCFLATAADRTLIPYLFKLMIEKIEMNTDSDKTELFHSLLSSVAFLILVSFVLEILFRIKGFIEAIIMPKFLADIRMQSNTQVQSYPLGYFSKETIGSIANKINDLPASSENLVITMVEVLVPVVCTAFISIAMIYAINKMLSMVFLMWFVSHMFVTFYFSSKCAPYANRHAQELSSLKGIIIDSMDNILNIKAFNLIKHEQSYIGRFQDIEKKKYTSTIIHIEKTKVILSVLTIVEYGGALFCSLWGWKNGKLGIGDLVFIFNVLNNIVVLAWWLSLELPFFFRNIGILRQGLQVLELPENMKNEEGERELKIAKGRINFIDITFGYSPNKMIFKNLSVDIRPGSKVGLVGFSGSGKSTLVNLLQKFYPLNNGKIEIDNQDIRDVTNESLMRSIATVPQNVVLFQRTIAENILCANPNASYSDMLDASKKAYCHDFIMKTENGYNTIVGSATLGLSGGQKQLIGLARAIIKNSPILILDEATSALDYVTEIKIKNIVDEIMGDKTILIIAHRLSTLKTVDRILVFQGGEIIEDGTHESLLEKDSHYAFLWNTNTNGFIV